MSEILTAPEEKYRLTARGKVSTLHRDPATERCNLDETDRDEAVDEMTAGRLLDAGDAAPCAYCFPKGE